MKSVAGYYLVLLLLASSGLIANAQAAKFEPEDASLSVTASGDTIYFRDNTSYHNWIAWDERLDRERIAEFYLFSCPQPEDPWREYVKATRFHIEVDSLGLTEFRALPAADQRHRQDLARQHLDQAARFKLIIDELHDLLTANEAYEKITVPIQVKGAGECLTRCLGHLVAASAIDPADSRTWYDLAYFSGIIGDWNRCRGNLETALAVLGDSSVAVDRDLRLRIYLDLAWLARNLGQSAGGIAWADKALELDAENHEARLIRGLSLADLGEFDAAMLAATLLEKVRIYKFTWGYYLHDYASSWIRGLVFLRQGKPDLARYTLGRIDLKKKFPYARYYWTDLGGICERLGLREEAEECYSMAGFCQPYCLYYPFAGFRGGGDSVERAPSDFTFYQSYEAFYAGGSLFSYAVSKARSHEMEMDPLRKQTSANAALLALSACVEREMYPADALAWRGRLYHSLGDNDRAADDFDRACGLINQPAIMDAALFYISGILALKNEQFNKAVRRLTSASELTPEDARTWRSLGVAFIQVGALEEGLRALDRSLELDGESADAWYNRGLFYYHQGNWKQAQDDLTAAAERAPGNSRIAELLARLESLVTE